MNIKKVAFGVVCFIILCIVYYCLYPKYEFNQVKTVFMRYNRITGSIEVVTLSDIMMK
jgi:cytochrome c-type biogenesis protein CcmH/NrfG